MITLQQVHDEAQRMLEGAPDGAPLDEATAQLVAFSVRIAVTTLDTAGAAVHAQAALRAGVTPAQLREALFLVSGLGVHSLFEGLGLTQPAGAAAGESSAEPDASRQALWDTWVGTDRYWQGFERELPGFLPGLLEASPDGFDAFFRYCAVPWKSGQLPALSKELIAMACDATPTHRYLPGMRLHLRNALKLGAGQAMVRGALELAAQAPPHPGVGANRSI
ncbi:MAG TPA: carboxymuconolactone decarboxylase family protein [Ramlibacter sp.]|nr:carboxymuconolactone decarboxylase family protein [Ramlibacter sp.]